MKAVKKVLTLLLILTIISQIFIPSYVKAQNTIRTYDSNSLYDEVAKNAVLDNKRSEYVDSDTGIDFTQGASSTNGQGVYTIASTKDDLYPIHYYRGNIDNNNVLFGGFCWQIVRTTETGGVKLIYNGEPDENGKCEDTVYNRELNFSYDEKNKSYMYGYDFKNVGYGYLSLDWYRLADNSSEDIYYSKFYDIPNEEFYYSEEVEYSKETDKYTLKDAQHHNSGDSIDEIKSKTPLYYCDYDLESCNGVKVVLWDTYKMNFNSAYYIRLSNGMTYEDVKKINLVFSNDVEYKDGHYELKNIINIPLMSVNAEENIKKVLGGHHYFCDNFTDSCESINYVYDYYHYDYDNDYEFSYTTFFDGDKVDDLYNEFKNSTNENNSTIKDIIDKWYSSNLVDNTEYLEDTVWCNDRSTIDANVFNKDSNILSTVSSNNYEKLNISLACTNKNDRFTVNSKNGNGKLLYPVATITAQETIYAGNSSTFETGDYGDASFLKAKYRTYYTMTTLSIEDMFVFDYELSYPASGCAVSLGGSGCGKYSVRPMISLKHSMVVSSGDGTQSEPYKVVEGDTAEVQYVVDGNAPNGFLPPKVESYLKGSKVKMNGLKAGDIVNGYRFLGWHTEDVTVDGDTFDMPENKVVFVGKFEKIEDSPLTYDSISKYITTGIIGVVGLFGLVLLRKKI